ncbi:MAG: Asp23/Gls24 family envelope stress response protein [Lachnospiraceae bacterium]|nr:Asp23/Gls24 family envelope stress response protein [Lachnospiraceae bacterium]
MENVSENELDNYEAADAIGSVQISDDVVAMIAGLAVSEAEGASYPDQGITAGDTAGKNVMKKMLKNVKVDVAGDSVSVDVSIAVDYGRNIPQTCQNVQTKVKSAIETMTGLMVSDVNVRVAKVNMQ